MLSKTEIALKIDQKHSEYFEIFRGVKQRDTISLINDLGASFNTEECKPPELLNSKVGSLAFADDLLIISESKEGLQNSVNKLNMFCDNWQLTLNVKKTKTMVVQQNTIQVSPFIDFKGDVIQNVTEYTLLGCLFKYNGNIRHSLEELAKKARKVLFSWREKTSSLGILPISVSINLFNKLVRPILT
jgi:phage terminase small subunit